MPPRSAGLAPHGGSAGASRSAARAEPHGMSDARLIAPRLIAPRLIALDWGTSSLRAYLLGDAGVTLDRRAAPHGIMQLADGGFPAAFSALTDAWRSVSADLPVLASGMVGSAQGWSEAPYVGCPAGDAELAAGLHPVALGERGVLHIVPGVASLGAMPNVMRGEETQIVGTLGLLPQLAADSLLVMPGTHSKWVSVQDGRIASFSTMMTGELFALLSAHSILGRPARDAGPAGEAEAEVAFGRGVDTARDAAAGVGPLLFSARTLVLTNRLAASASLDYLSGLLIGDELRCGLSHAGSAPPLALVGDPALCERYGRALARFGRAATQTIADAAPAGLWRLANAAGLVASGDTGPAQASSDVDRRSA